MQHSICIINCSGSEINFGFVAFLTFYFVSIDDLLTKQKDKNILNANKMPALTDMDLLITSRLLNIKSFFNLKALSYSLSSLFFLMKMDSNAESHLGLVTGIILKMLQCWEWTSTEAVDTLTITAKQDSCYACPSRKLFGKFIFNQIFPISSFSNCRLKKIIPNSGRSLNIFSDFWVSDTHQCSSNHMSASAYDLLAGPVVQTNSWLDVGTICLPFTSNSGEPGLLILKV